MLKAPANKLLVTIDKKYQDKIGGLFIDNTFEPEEYATLNGVVVSVPEILDDDPYRANINQLAKTGDEVWFSYGVVFDFVNRVDGQTPEYRNLIRWEGKEYWQVEYPEVYAIRRGDEILVPTQHIILKPIKAPEEMRSAGGLIIPRKSVFEEDVAEVVAVPGGIKNVFPGDKIPIEPRYTQKYILFSEQHYVIPVRRLLAKMN